MQEDVLAIPKDFLPTSSNKNTKENPDLYF